MTTKAESIEPKRREALHSMLTKLRDETYERVHELRHEQAEDTETDPGDEMDRARADTDLETHASLIARAEERLRYIDEALGRLAEGRYGICAGCREHIPLERLRAVPFAVYCVDCQQKPNRAGRGWNDGTMIEPYDQQWTPPAEMVEQPEHSAASDEVLSVSSGSPFAEGKASESARPVPPRAPRPRKK
jgi:DnaK suppressor protein